MVATREVNYSAQHGLSQAVATHVFGSEMHKTIPGEVYLRQTETDIA